MTEPAGRSALVHSGDRVNGNACYRSPTESVGTSYGKTETRLLAECEHALGLS